MPGRLAARLDARPSRRAFTTSPNDLRIRREDGAAFGARPRSAASPSESRLSRAEIALGSIKLGGRSLARSRGLAAKGVVFPVSASRSRRLNAVPEAGGEEMPPAPGLSLHGQCPARAAWITAVASFRFCARVCSSARRIADAKSVLIHFPYG
jgi:hypothetical protein